MIEPGQPPTRHHAVLRSLHVLSLLIVIGAALSAQMTRGRIGLTAALPQGPDLGVTYAASESMRLNLGLGFSTSSPDSGASRSSFLVRTGAWFVRPAVDGVSLFFGGALEFDALSAGASTGDLGLVAQAGAEYAVARSFAVATVVGLGFRTGDTSASGLPGSRITTSSVAVVLTWWVL